MSSLPRILAAAALIIASACGACGKERNAAVRSCLLRTDAVMHQAPHLDLTQGKDSTTRPTMDMRVHLPLRDEAGLDELLKQLYDPTSPQYLKFLTPEEFRSRFHPKSTHVVAMIDHLRYHGLDVQSEPHGALLKARGSVKKAERAFGSPLRLYPTAQGGHVLAPEKALAAPNLPPLLAVHGLSGHQDRQTHLVAHAEQKPMDVAGLHAADIRRAYNLPSTLTAAGETIGFVQLDGFLDSDLDQYARVNSLRRVPTRRVLIGKASAKVHGEGQTEVTMDLELANALAPDAKEFVVYTAQNNAAGWHDMLNEIANPKDGKVVRYISCSWGTPEDQMTSAGVQAEAALFKQLAAQGVFFASASGDLGSKDDGHHVGTDDPASQSWVLGVGGTSLALTTQRLRDHETAWSGSGGGVSCYWPNPWWQSVRLGIPAIDNARNVPDVALHADPMGPSGGHVIIVNGKAQSVGGTSAAAPLWTAIAAGVGSLRAQMRLRPLGAWGPHIHRVGMSSWGQRAFFHIDQGTNGDFKASPDTDYDNVCGFGTPQGVDFVSAMTSQ